MRNVLLNALPHETLNDLAPHLQVIRLEVQDVLHRPQEPVKFVYFPGEGFCSMVTVLEDGNMVEAATIGREGMVGLAARLKGGTPSAMTIAQSAMDCYRLPAEVFRAEMNKCGPLHDILTRYSEAMVGVVMQTTACNAVHSIEQRLSRWLLTAQKRVEKDEFPLTQEFVAMMLGAARPTVTLVAGMLQREGLITYRRGQVHILNQKGLEAASCECYRTTTALLDAVMGARPARAAAPRKHRSRES